MAFGPIFIELPTYSKVWRIGGMAWEGAGYMRTLVPLLLTSEGFGLAVSLYLGL